MLSARVLRRPPSGPLALRLLRPTPRRLFGSAPTAAQDEALKAWLDGLTTHRERHEDVVASERTRQMAHTLPLPSIPVLTVGSALPPAWHLMLFQPDHDLATLGPDGAERGGFYPPAQVGPMERMWAGGVMQWERNQLRVGQKVSCETRLRHPPELKKGKRGDMIFVYTDRLITNEAGLAVTETRCHMYRRPIPTPSSPSPAAAASGPLAPAHVVPEGAEAAQLRFVPSMPQLFRFSALTFNSHRIHYDRRYCQESEHRPDCVVHGPMTALLLTTTVAAAVPPSARLSKLTYRATAPLYVDRPVSFTTYRMAATVGERWSVWATSDHGELAMTGEVVVGRA